MNGIFGITRSFSTNYYMMVAMEFLEASLGAGAYSTAFVLGKLDMNLTRHFIINIQFSFRVTLLNYICYDLLLRKNKSEVFFKKYRYSKE